VQEGVHLSASPSDGAIIAASLERPQLFATVFDRHFAAIHRYLARRADGPVADDLASQTFVVALERRGTFREGERDARPWLYGIATNLLRNHRREEQRQSQVDAAVEATGPWVVEAAPALARIESAEQRAALEAALAQVDPDQRDVLLLYALAELSYEEIAAALSLPVGTVRSRLSRARAHLRSLLSNPAAGRDRLELATSEREQQ
jgi:RNA polymerase sigma-70 factor (ECF subfamily)